MEVGSKVTTGWEDTFLILTLALTIELLPSLTHEVELRLEVHHDLDLLT